MRNFERTFTLSGLLLVACFISVFHSISEEFVAPFQRHGKLVRRCYTKDFRVWCTRELCSDTAVKNEEEKIYECSSIMFAERRSVRENVTSKNLEEKLLDPLFVELLSAPTWIMQSQKLVVVASSYIYPPRNTLDWVYLQPWPVFISSKVKELGIASEPWGNKGREITSYVRFILMFWGSLPERIAFVHGHEKAWHQEGYKLSYMLRNVCLSRYEYISLSAFENDAWRLRKGSMAYYKVLQRYWYIVEPYLGEFPKDGFHEKCCAQFIVSRDRIVQRPREFYEIILRQTLSAKHNQKNKNSKKIEDIEYFWEAIWHYIMGEPAIINTRRKYGFGIDKNIETGQSLSKKPERTLKNIIACPVLNSTST